MNETGAAGHLAVIKNPDGSECFALFERCLHEGDAIEILLWDEWFAGEVFFVGGAPWVRTQLAPGRIAPFAFLRWPSKGAALPN